MKDTRAARRYAKHRAQFAEQVVDLLDDLVDAYNAKFDAKEPLVVVVKAPGDEQWAATYPLDIRDAFEAMIYAKLQGTIDELRSMEPGGQMASPHVYVLTKSAFAELEIRSAA